MVPSLLNSFTEIKCDIPYALLMLQQNLSPLERAIYMLRECFSFNHKELSEIFEITGENCRQILHRAK